MFKTTPHEEWYHRLQQTDRVMTAAEFAAWRDALMSEHRIDVIPFRGESTRNMTDAQDRASAALQAWYAEQVVLFTGGGGSVFEFSTVAYHDGPLHVFIITVFDTRHRPDRPPHID